MFKYFIKIVYRTFLRNKLNSFINIFGLAIGLSSFILISLYVNYELNWDTYHENHEKTYLLNKVMNYSGEEQFFDQTPGGFANGLKESIPEIEKAACIMEIWGEILSSSDEKSIYEQSGYYADQSIFEIFSVEFLFGDPVNALSDPNSIVFTESLANKHFGTSDVIGKTIRTDNKSYSITAVIRDFPFNSTFRVSYFIPLSVYNERYETDIYSDWERSWSRTIIQLKDSDQRELVSQMAAEVINEHISDPTKKCSVHLEPLSKLHLEMRHSGFYYIMMIYSVLGILILILSAINFLNLSTALSSIRTREIGVKKVFGSVRSKLAAQFLGESLLNAMLALILAFGIAEFLLPFFNIMTDRILKIDYLGDWKFVLFVVGSAVALGLLSGLYPSLYLSRFNPVKVLKSGSVTSKRSKRLSGKKILTGLQFIISISFIIGTIGFFTTVNYVMKKDVGFERERVLFTEIEASKNLKINTINQLRDEFKSNNEIENVAISYYVPFDGQGNYYMDWEGAHDNEKIKSTYNRAGDQFLETYKIPIVRGRNFSNDLASDSSACVVSETFVKKVGWEDPIGKKVWNNKYTIVGVVQDFHIEPPLDPRDPYMFVRHSGNLSGYKMLSFKLKPGYSDETIEFIHKKLKELFPDNYFELKFVADIMYGETYRLLFKVAQTMMYFTCVAILIALVGLFSLVSFSIKLKVREIGIRKIMGASVAKIYLHLSKEFMVLLIISNIIAIPLGLMLLDAIPFAYTPDFNIIPILMVVVASVFVTLSSISYWVLKTARANPVDSIRYE